LFNTVDKDCSSGCNSYYEYWCWDERHGRSDCVKHSFTEWTVGCPSWWVGNSFTLLFLSCI